MESISEGEPLTNFSLLLADASMPQAGMAVSFPALIIIILILLLFSAILSGAEIAFFSMTSKDINYLKTKQEPGARSIVNLLDNPQKLLATILISNNFINLGVIICTNMMVEQFLSAWIPADISPNMHYLTSFLVQVTAVTFFLVLFGEVLPKVYATQRNMRMAFFSAPFLQIFNTLFSPLSNWLVSSSSFIETRLTNHKQKNVSNEEFEHAIELTVGHSATKEEVNIFKGIVKFSDIAVKQIMHTRLDVVGLKDKLTFREVQQKVVEAGYSRMPVYKDNLDHIIGMIHTKDLLPYVEQGDFDWTTLLRPAYFVHESKMIEDLLREFQLKRIHLAVVVDEFGGTSGIVTLEDIMEEVIGDIRDEFDEDDLNFKKLDDNNFIFEGKTLLNDVCRVLNVNVEDFDQVRGESDSLGGLLLELSGKFPLANEVIMYKEYSFTVLEIEKNRIQKVKVSINPEQSEID